MFFGFSPAAEFVGRGPCEGRRPLGIERLGPPVGVVAGRDHEQEAVLDAQRHLADQIRLVENVEREPRHLARVGVAQELAGHEIVAETDVDHAQIVGGDDVFVDVVERLGEDVVEEERVHLPALVDADRARVADDAFIESDRIHARAGHDAVDARPRLRGPDDAGDVHAVMGAAARGVERERAHADHAVELDGGVLGKSAVDDADLGTGEIRVRLAVGLDDVPDRRNADRLQAPIAVRALAGIPAPAVGGSVDRDLGGRGIGQTLRSHGRVDEGAVDDRLLSQILDDRRLEDLLELGLGIGLAAACAARLVEAQAARGSAVDHLDGDDAERRDELGDLKIVLLEQRLDVLLACVGLELDDEAVLLGNRHLALRHLHGPRCGSLVAQAAGSGLIAGRRSRLDRSRACLAADGDGLHLAAVARKVGEERFEPARLHAALLAGSLAGLRRVVLGFDPLKLFFLDGSWRGLPEGASCGRGEFFLERALERLVVGRLFLGDGGGNSRQRQRQGDGEGLLSHGRCSSVQL